MDMVRLDAAIDLRVRHAESIFPVIDIHHLYQPSESEIDAYIEARGGYEAYQATLLAFGGDI